MAFTPLTLQRVSSPKGHGLGGPSLWLYSTADAMTTVDDSGYFASGKMLGMNLGDCVIVTKTVGPALYIAYVNDITSGNATVSAATTVS